ncbi:hypothetical protein HCUR_00980 [Holospora curviuscula]|uniref:Uncharacterized protein n=1 Tax=Holospora curviuscula TaxID=1082868 RepID=A0A2S5R8D8_9PROT|nr:hypothetical protein HCUR_00980 [Holospora curviuscula]
MDILFGIDESGVSSIIEKLKSILAKIMSIKKNATLSQVKIECPLDALSNPSKALKDIKPLIILAKKIVLP